MKRVSVSEGRKMRCVPCSFGGLGDGGLGALSGSIGKVLGVSFIFVDESAVPGCSLHRAPSIFFGGLVDCIYIYTYAYGHICIRTRHMRSETKTREERKKTES